MLNRVQKEKTALQQELDVAKAQGQEVDTLKLKLAQLESELAEVSDLHKDICLTWLIAHVFTASNQTRGSSNEACSGFAHERDEP
jgi:hypothetical protein